MVTYKIAHPEPHCCSSSGPAAELQLCVIIPHVHEQAALAAARDAQLLVKVQPINVPGALQQYQQDYQQQYQQPSKQQSSA